MRENLVSRGVLTVRRSDSEMKRNAEIGLFTKPSGFVNHEGTEQQEDDQNKLSVSLLLNPAVK